MYLAIAQARDFAQAFQIKMPVYLTEEACVPVIPALDNMKRDTRNLYSVRARHLAMAVL